MMGGGAPTTSTLPTLLGAWGMKFESSQVLADHTHATMLGGNRLGLAVLTLPQDMMPQKDNVITKDLGSITLFLPGAFINSKFVPLASLVPGEVNPIDVSSWNHRLRLGEDVHVAVTAEFEVNQFALAADNGQPLSNRTSVFRPNNGGWASYNRNLMLGAVVGVATSIDSDEDRADRLELHQNYPNPFNPTTVVGFQLSVFGHTSLKVYDMLGREVATLVDGVMSAGSHQVTFDGSALSSGIYLVRLTAGSESRVMRMTLLK
jgi:hypothetical protein